MDKEILYRKAIEPCTTHQETCDRHEYRYREMEEALETIYNWADFALQQKTLLSAEGLQKIKDMAAAGLGLKEND